MISQTNQKAKPSNWPGGIHKGPGRLLPLEERIREFESRRNKPQPKAKTYTLVLNHANGATDVYGDENNNVKILNVPNTSTIENERQVERLISSVLSKPYRDVFFPGSNLRAIGNHKAVTLSDVLRITETLELVGSQRYSNASRAQLAVMEG